MSYNSCSLTIPVMKAMFPDSEICRKINLGYTKAAYIISFGLAPSFQQELSIFLNHCDYYVLCFDEALNKISQSGQMDIHIRFFNECKVESRYYTSVFMRYTTAEDILKYFLKGIESLKRNRILQVRHFTVKIFNGSNSLILHFLD